MKSWLKGGLIGAGIFSIIEIFFLMTKDIESNIRILFGMFTLPGSIIYVLLTGNPYLEITTGVLVQLFIIGLIFYFLLGALIGWIVSKIKRK